ncbi:TPA: hypothetical protein GRR63_12095 [Vibrio parahaemolyticus]|nr:hypothetical protein [Vibrio parahaemolyticus]
MNLNLNPKTPKKINSTVKALIAELGINNRNAQYLKYTHKSDDYRARYCFNNCETEAVKNGGEVVYGWLIWEDRKRSFIEAEFHSVLKVNGEILDISPRQDSKDEKVLFVEDTLRDSGRKDPETWHSWSNMRMISGRVIEQSRRLEVFEVDDINSDVRYV